MTIFLTQDELPVTGGWVEGNMKFLLVKVSNTFPYFISLLTVSYEEWDETYKCEWKKETHYIQKEYVELYQYYIKHNSYPESIVDIASNYLCIQSYWDNYSGFWDEEETQASFYCDSKGSEVIPSTQCLHWQTLTEVPPTVLQSALEHGFAGAIEYVLNKTIESNPEIENS